MLASGNSMVDTPREQTMGAWRSALDTSHQLLVLDYGHSLNPQPWPRWLAKAGDDLRQDQRVQHVFRCMNRILSLDAQCAQRRLAVQTYKVYTPLHPSSAHPRFSVLDPGPQSLYNPPLHDGL